MPLATEEEMSAGSPLVPAVQAPAPEQAAPATGAPKPDESLRDAAFAQSNILGSVLQKKALGGYDYHAPVPNYDPYANDGAGMRGYEDHMDRFVNSESPEQTQVIKNLIDAENSNRETIARAGTLGYVSAMANGAMDPLSLTLMLIPGLEGSAVARIGSAAAINVGAGEAQSAALAYNSETTNYTDGIIPRIGANALISGVLGAFGGRVPKEEFNAAAGKVQEYLDRPMGSTAGAMEVPKTTLEDESIALGGQGLAKSMGKINPSARIMSSSMSVEARRLAQQFVDFTPLLNKHFQGEPSLPDLETIITNQENGRDYQFIRNFDQSFADYKKSGGEMSKNEFGEHAGWAMSDSDKSDIPEAAAHTKFLRQMFDADHKFLVESGAIKESPDSAGLMGAPSYYPRVPDQPYIRANRMGVEATLRDWFTTHPKTESLEPTPRSPEELRAAGAARDAVVSPAKETHDAAVKAAEEAHAAKPDLVVRDAARAKAKEAFEAVRKPAEDAYKAVTETHGPPQPIYREPAEVEAAVQDTIDHYLSMPRGVADIGQSFTPRPLKHRVNDVPDHILGPILSRDHEHIVRSYTRAIVPYMQMKRAFPEGIEAEFQKVTDEYHRLQTAGKTNEEKNAIGKNQEATFNNLKMLHDNVMHTLGSSGNPESQVMRGGMSLARAYNYKRVLGGQTLSALPDFGRLVNRYGLANTSYRTAQFLSGINKDLQKTVAQRLNTALDGVLHIRQHTIDGGGDELMGSKLRRSMGNSTARFTKMTGIADWDAMLRTLSATQEQDAIFRAITKGNLPDIEVAKLAQHGIGTKDLDAIREQWLKHGDHEGGLNTANTHLWENRAAAEKVERAVQKAASTTAFYIGKGDMPGFANSQVGKFMFQFKGFAVGSVNRLMIPMAQGIAHKDLMAMNGFIISMALGALSYYTKEVAFGRKPDLSPGVVMANALQRSGVLGFAPDVVDPLAGMFHLPRFAKFTDLNPVDTAMGATVGGAASTIETITKMTRGNISASDLHKIRQLLPYQNLFYAARMINMIEGKTADALDLKGAPGTPALDYLNPAKDPDPKFHPSKEHLFGIEAVPNAF